MHEFTRISSPSTTEFNHARSATPEQDHVNRVYLPSPVISNKELAGIKAISQGVFKCQTVDITFPASEGEAGLPVCVARSWVLPCHAATCSGLDSGSSV